MRLPDLAEKIGARILTATRADGVDILHVYAGDRVSDLLTHAGPQTILVTNLAGAQLVRVAELMDMPGICLVNGHQPDADVLRAANAHGLSLMSSPAGMYETCGRLYRCLDQSGK
jgi:hypothetical protein